MKHRSCTALGLLLYLSGVARALLADFSGSFSQYQQATMQPADFDKDGGIGGEDYLTWQRGLGLDSQPDSNLGDADRDGKVNNLDLDLWAAQFGVRTAAIPSSAAFKLFFDPAGIVSGAVTVFVDVPDPLPGQPRFELDYENAIIARHPDYEVFQLGSPMISTGAGRERFEVRVGFTAKNPASPPAGPVTIFGYQVVDEQSQFGFQGIQLGFLFDPGDFITTDNGSGQQTTLDDTQLADVPLGLQLPLLLDVDTQSGAVTLRNASLAPTSITAYQIISAARALDVAGWVSLDELEGPDGPGVGWEEAGGSGAFALGESNLTGSLLLNPGQTKSLGLAFNPNVGVQNLVFSYATAGGLVVTGAVNYLTPPPGTPVPEVGCLGLATLGDGQRGCGPAPNAPRAFVRMVRITSGQFIESRGRLLK